MTTYSEFKRAFNDLQDATTAFAESIGEFWGKITETFDSTFYEIITSESQIQAMLDLAELLRRLRRKTRHARLRDIKLTLRVYNSLVRIRSPTFKMS